jgi:hypothetical protein
MVPRIMNLPGLTIRGRIAQCWLFVYRAPAESVAALLPRTMEPVTKGGFAFWNIVVCRLEGIRPVPLPAAIGLGYWHVAYRIHVRTFKESGEAIEGLFFVRSDSDRRVMALAGNLLTDFNFHLAQVHVVAAPAGVSATIVSPEAAATFEIDRVSLPQLTPGSPFDSLEAAARALEYEPAALSGHGEDAVSVSAVRRDAACWRWKPVAVTHARWQFFDGRDTALELCYEVEPIDYLWEARRVVRVKPCTS